MPKFVLIEPCNFEDFPVGGQLSFARQLMAVFQSEIALVGYAKDADPVGEWFEKEIDGIKYQYFAFAKPSAVTGKPLIPLRIQNLAGFAKYLKKIQLLPLRNWFIQAPEVLIPASRVKGVNICYMFPGVENPLEKPRYRWGKLFAKVFYNQFTKALNQCHTLVACADQEAIEALITRAPGLNKTSHIHQFPTRYDAEIFFPQDKLNARRELNLPLSHTILVTSGRINSVKGWRLLLEAFSLYHTKNVNSQLVFVGDGEDAELLKRKAEELGLQAVVSVTGFKKAKQVATYLNAADVYLVGSENEGWSVAMLEALACGKPLVSTKVSGATSLIAQNENGYVVTERDPGQFATCIDKVFSLTSPETVSVAIAQKYQLQALKHDLLLTWQI